MRRSMQRCDVQFTAAGYLVLDADVAKTYFPGDVLVALRRGPELWLLPTRGAAAGGLILKQRNAQRDRSVLVRETLNDEVHEGVRDAFWDDSNGALRVALVPRD
jgi:hydrogenase maturation protease